MVKAKSLIAFFSTGLITGFIIGLGEFINEIIANQYIQYKMFGIIIQSLPHFLNKWVLLLAVYTIVIIALYIIIWPLFVRLSRIVWELLYSGAVNVNINNRDRLISGVVTCIFCFVFFFFGGWAINHYLLPHKLHVISLIFNGVFLLFAIYLGRILAKKNWRNLFDILIEKKYILKFALFIIVLLLFSNVYPLIDSKTNTPDGPNIILISVDTLRADHLGSYGYEKNTSPNIDNFAKEGILFENCFSHASSTNPSFSSILSGFLPHETKVLNNVQRFPLKINTVAEFLKNKGYMTSAIVSNFVLSKKSFSGERRGFGLGFDQGFDLYNDRMDDEEIVRHVPERIAENTTKDAIDFLKKHYKQKFFLWVHYQDPHGPYTPKPPYNTRFQNDGGKSFDINFNTSVSGKSGIPSYQRLGDNKDVEYYVSQYDGEILYFDNQFKNLIEELKKLDLYDDSLIIFTSDHGEGMGEHDYFFAHGEYLYNSLIHVPLIVKYNKETKGRRKDFVQHIDILPTILEVLGIYTDIRFRGENLLNEGLHEKEIYSETEDTYSIILDKIKLIYRILEKKYLLFDLRNDFHEENNLITHINYNESAEYLKERLEYIRNENLLGIDIANKPLEITDEHKEKLKALGYVN